ncbi:MAG: hypothetical protein M9933_15265 [Chitinophagaceae bacterium]|nr:hypothetical protein [Chitinophagaceae bacterium]
MKLHIICLLLLCCSGNASFAQDYFYNNYYYDKDFLWEAGLSLGAINCLTDIGGRAGRGKKFLKDMNPENTRVSGGIFVGLNYRYALGLRLELNTGTLTAFDSILKNDRSEAHGRYLRNLHFKSPLTEWLLLAEIHPLRFGGMNEKPNIISPYLIVGAGCFRFDPRANLNGAWIALHDLHTEGQGFPEYPDRQPYRLTQLNFPVGIGIKVECSALLNIRLEILHRFTHTDYLDDVSTRYIDPALFKQYLAPEAAALALLLHDRQGEIDATRKTIAGSIRGNDKRNDSYFTVQCKLSMIMGRERR